MRSRPAVRLVALAVALSAAVGAQDVGPERPPVESVSVAGNLRVGTDYILSQVQTEPGKPYDPKTIDEDIRRLAGLGYFSNIEVEQVRGRDGYRITFIVEENVLVQSIVFIGIEEEDEDDIRPLVKLRPGQPLVRYLLHLDRERIRQYYLEEGYLFVEVTVESRESLSGEEVVFRIDEGPEVEVDRVRFVGNHTFDGGDLQKLMQLEESWIFDSTQFREELLREDLVVLKTYYRSKGFFDVYIDVQDVGFDADLEDMSIVIFVEEGPRYRVRDIEVEGLDLFQRQELDDRFLQRPGEFFDQQSILADKAKIEELYRQNAYLEASVDIDFFYTTEGYEVTLVYTVSEGQPFRIGRIDFAGNIFTRDDVLRRNIEQLPWQYANVVKIRNSIRNLQQTGYFASVGLTVEDGRHPGEKDLDFEVEEGQTGSIRFAAGLTSNVGFIGDISLEKRNFDISDMPKSWDDLFSGGAFTGGGQHLILQVQPGTELFRFRAGFQEPYLFGYPYSLGINFQQFSRKRESYDEERIGGDITLGHQFQFDPHLVGSVTYRNELVELTDIDDDAPAIVQLADDSTSIASMTLGWVYDVTDDPILPTKGYRIQQTTEVASEFLAGDEEFYKLDFRAEWYKTVYRHDDGSPHVIRLAGRVGWGDAFGSSSEIPIFERYFAGGFGSLRGFKFRGVGPMQNGDPIGGEFLALASIEYTFPIYKDLLRGVFFVDAGTVGRTNSNLELDKLRVSTGMGVRLKIPFLGQRPFAVDFGFPLRQEDDDEEEIVSFSLGRSF